MVKNLHAAGFEVILDVVYNHTAESNADRADLLLPRLRRRATTTCYDGNGRYVDVTGCGNTVARLATGRCSSW